MEKIGTLNLALIAVAVTSLAVSGVALTLHGPIGPIGATGPTGSAGINGTNGANGINGKNGTNGTNYPYPMLATSIVLTRNSSNYYQITSVNASSVTALVVTFKAHFNGSITRAYVYSIAIVNGTMQNNGISFSQSVLTTATWAFDWQGVSPPFQKGSVVVIQMDGQVATPTSTFEHIYSQYTIKF